MSQRVEDQFSEEDHQLLMDHQLGRLLHVYTLRQGYILFNRIVHLLVFILCDAFVGLLIIFLLRVVEQSVIFDLLIWFGGLVFLWAAGWYLWIGLRHEEQSRRLLIGEEGLLEIRKMIRKNRLEVIHWKDIRAIRRMFMIPEYLIKRQRGGFFVLTSYAFRKGNELISLIREHKAEWDS